QLDVDVPGGVGYRLDGAGGERGPADVGVHDDPGRVEHRREGGGAGGQDRQGGGGDLGRGDVPVTGTLLRGDDRGSDTGAPEPRRGSGEGWLCEQGVGAGDRPARVLAHRRSAPSVGRRERPPPSWAWRRRTGIEPARPSCSASPVLKTGGTTRNPDASVAHPRTGPAHGAPACPGDLVP